MKIPQWLIPWKKKTAPAREVVEGATILHHVAKMAQFYAALQAPGRDKERYKTALRARAGFLQERGIVPPANLEEAQQMLGDYASKYGE